MSGRKGAGRLNRRALLSAAALGLGVAALPDAAADRVATDPVGATEGPARRRHFHTPVSVPLARDTVTIGIVQSPVAGVQASSAVAARRTHLRHMCEAAAEAFHHGRHHDLLFFHGCALTPPACDRSHGELRRHAIDLPGEESEQLAALARAHGCHIAFSAYVTDPDWPGRVLALGVLLDDHGSIVARHWRLMHERTPDGELLEPQVTTLDCVLDEYLERYAPDARLPVATTALGNISLHCVQGEPELVRALAAHGCEIMLRSAAMGYSVTDMAAGSLHNGMYTAVATAAWPGEGAMPPGMSAARSMVIGPRGETLAAAQTSSQQVLTVRIPIGSYRLRHRPPVLPERLLQRLA